MDFLIEVGKVVAFSTGFRGTLVTLLFDGGDKVEQYERDTCMFAKSLAYRLREVYPAALDDCVSIQEVFVEAIGLELRIPLRRKNNGAVAFVTSRRLREFKEGGK